MWLWVVLRITYFDGMNDQKQISSVSVPWTLTFDNRATYPMVGVNGLQVSCTIGVNGQVRDQKTATGRYSVVNCSARACSSAGFCRSMAFCGSVARICPMTVAVAAATVRSTPP